jgi:GNAT superfamily N-acetyltransferase
MRVVRLQHQHRSLAAAFENQHSSLVECLRRFAERHDERDLLSRTWVAIDDGRIAGYFTLSMASVERASLGVVPTLASLPKFPVPAIQLARLAVDRRVQQQGLGRFLFEEALGRVLQLLEDGPVGFRLFVADAIDETAAAFYDRRGFHAVDGGWPRRMVLDLQPLAKAMRVRGGR